MNGWKFLTKMKSGGTSVSDKETETQETTQEPPQEERQPRAAESSINQHQRLWGIREPAEGGSETAGPNPGGLLAVVVGEPTDAMIDLFHDMTEHGILCGPVGNGFQILVSANGGWILHDPGA